MTGIRDLIETVRPLVASQPQEAIALVEQARSRTGNVPVALDLMLARAYVVTGQPQRAIDVLQPLVLAQPGSPNVEKAMGVALHAAGRIPEAMGFLERAFRAEAQPEPRTGAPPEAPALDHEALRDFLVLDPHARALLVFVPKVACTVLKATVVMNGPARDRYNGSGVSIHRFVKLDKPEADVVARIIDSPEVVRWTVVREPLRRLLSAYLNKIVGNGPNATPKFFKLTIIRHAQAQAGIPFDAARSITFEEFVRALAGLGDAEMDIHWMPQSRIVGADLGRYAHIGQMEKLGATFDFLKQRLGYVPEDDPLPHLGSTKPHVSRFNPVLEVDAPHRLLPHQLRALRRGFPPADSFYTDELRDIVRTRYAADFALHAAAG